MGSAFASIGAAVARIHSLPEGAAAQFDGFHRLLMEWNDKMDLTAVPEGEMLVRHYLDSLTALHLLPENSRVVDVGTGAGFPGMPLALARPDLSLVLLDALRKRIDFLRAAIEALGLGAAGAPRGNRGEGAAFGDAGVGDKNLPIRESAARAEAVHGRAEDYARIARESFDAAVSRAVATLPVLLEWMLPLVRVGGRCVIWKGPGAGDELAEANRVAPMLGGGEASILTAPVPGGEGHALVIVEKTAATPDRFPRRGGAAKKRL